MKPGPDQIVACPKCKGQDSGHLAGNLQAIEGLIQGLIGAGCAASDVCDGHEGVADFERHGNATLEPGRLAAVALICFGWTPGSLGDRVQSACTAIGRVLQVSTTVTLQGLMQFWPVAA